MSERVEIVVVDRCDRCGGRATHAAWLPGGGALAFCAHHTAEHRDALEGRGGMLVCHEDVAREALEQKGLL